MYSKNGKIVQIYICIMYNVHVIVWISQRLKSMYFEIHSSLRKLLWVFCVNFFFFKKCWYLAYEANNATFSKSHFFRILEHHYAMQIAMRDFHWNQILRCTMGFNESKMTDHDGKPWQILKNSNICAIQCSTSG